MAEQATDTPPDPGARIDAAITRIEAAVAVQAASAKALSRRHAALKMRMVEAVKALDEVIVRTPAA